ncbi:hypothetical protein [Actinomadura sp. WMMA1423]|uniref:hypothetical protein n=1 Tax=Actinomadura sp. WMMA1423 TaxID=2591108 RepID=UPI0011471BD8|nr:hypothetical protein [Actinomadura sp. WMMA1423]
MKSGVKLGAGYGLMLVSPTALAVYFWILGQHPEVAPIAAAAAAIAIAVFVACVLMHPAGRRHAVALGGGVWLATGGLALALTLFTLALSQAGTGQTVIGNATAATLVLAVLALFTGRAVTIPVNILTAIVAGAVVFTTTGPEALVWVVAANAVYQPALWAFIAYCERRDANPALPLAVAFALGGAVLALLGNSAGASPVVVVEAAATGFVVPLACSILATRLLSAQQFGVALCAPPTVMALSADRLGQPISLPTAIGVAVITALLCWAVYLEREQPSR